MNEYNSNDLIEVGQTVNAAFGKNPLVINKQKL